MLYKYMSLFKHFHIFQIVNLLQDGDWNTFCTEYAESKETGNRKYGRVTPGLAAKLYEKYVLCVCCFTHHQYVKRLTVI